MTPASAIYEYLKADAGVSALTVAHWVGAAQAGDQVFTIINIAESLGYATNDGLGDTQTTVTVNACAVDYERAWELAEAIRRALHAASGITNAAYTFSTLSFQNLANVIIDGQGQQTIYIIPQVFTCYLRRLT